MPAVPNAIQCARVCVCAHVIYEYMHVCERGAVFMCVYALAASCHAVLPILHD